MGHYDEKYILRESYGDEDQNELMRLIESWREDPEEEEDRPASEAALRMLAEAESRLAENIRAGGDDLPF